MLLLQLTIILFISLVTHSCPPAIRGYQKPCYILFMVIACLTLSSSSVKYVEINGMKEGRGGGKKKRKKEGREEERKEAKKE